ncbi:MAG: TlpA family protein disulfide reductase [Gammaproteobacteria bacterium]|nr:TlpA family protein disulfide reductase [Gammaproteobacteria bacterium]
MRALFLLLIGIFYSVMLEAATPPKGIIVQDGRMAPTIRLKNLDGDDFDLSKVEKKWKFVHFWASWCGPCRKEMPTIQEISTQLGSDKWQIVLINTAEDEDTVFSFASIVTPDLIPLLDKDGVISEQWQPRGLPSTYLVDPENKIRFIALGGRPWNEIEYLNFLRELAAPKTP